MPIRNVGMKIPSFLIGELDFCSRYCFFEFFKEEFEEKKISEF